MDDWDAFRAAADRPEPTVLRVNTGRISEADLTGRLMARGFALRAREGLPGFLQVESGPGSVALTLEHWLGLFYVQQASTGVAAPALGPRAGERVLDLCAAPGGKTTHAAELMEGRGCLVASEISESRIRGLLGNVYRLGHTNVLVVAGDGREFPEGALFDRVLVDAPCTGEGTLRRRGGRAPRQSASFRGYVTRAQRELLERAIRLTRPGGVILYVTCTFAPEENEAVVSDILASEPVDLEPLLLPVPHARGLTAFDGTKYDPRLEGAARIYPHQLDSGGLFLAKLRKLGGAGSDELGRGWFPVTQVFPGDELAAAEGAPVRDAAADDGGVPVDRGALVENGAPLDDGVADSAASLVSAAVEDLQGRFGVTPADLEGLRWAARGGRLWLHSLEEWPLDSWSAGGWRPISVGFRAVEFDTKGRPRPTNDLLQWLGGRVRERVFDVADGELAALVGRGAVPFEGGLRGPVAIRWRGEIVGRGAATGEGLKSEIPKARATDLARATHLGS